MEKQSYKPIHLYDEASNEISSDVGEQEEDFLRKNIIGRRQWMKNLTNGAVIAAFLLIWSLIVASLALRSAHNNRRVGQRFLKSPVDSQYIVYEPRVMEQWEDDSPESSGPYFTEPSEQIDRNWHNLFQCMFKLPHRLIIHAYLMMFMCNAN